MNKQEKMWEKLQAPYNPKSFEKELSDIFANEVMKHSKEYKEIMFASAKND